MPRRKIPERRRRAEDQHASEHFPRYLLPSCSCSFDVVDNKVSKAQFGETFQGSHYLAEETEIARIRWRFSFIL